MAEWDIIIANGLFENLGFRIHKQVLEHNGTKVINQNKKWEYGLSNYFYN